MIAFFLIFGGVFLRLLPHLPNFTPLSASAIFGGTHLKKRYALLIPLVAVIFSDYLLLYINPYNNPTINFSHLEPISAMFHATTLYVWGSLLISGLIGLKLKRHLKPSNIFLASLLASTQFYLITNFGVWASGMYSQGLNGLVQSYLMGLPFFRWTVLGDLFYSAVFFGTNFLANRNAESTDSKLNNLVKKVRTSV